MWKNISNSLNISFVRGHIHGWSCKKPHIFDKSEFVSPPNLRLYIRRVSEYVVKWYHGFIDCFAWKYLLNLVCFVHFYHTYISYCILSRYPRLSQQLFPRRSVYWHTSSRHRIHVRRVSRRIPRGRRHVHLRFARRSQSECWLADIVTCFTEIEMTILRTKHCCKRFHYDTSGEVNEKEHYKNHSDQAKPFRNKTYRLTEIAHVDLLSFKNVCCWNLVFSISFFMILEYRVSYHWQYRFSPRSNHLAWP